MIYRLFITLSIVLLLFAGLSPAQDGDKRLMSLTELMNAMANHSGYMFPLVDTTMEFDPTSADSLFSYLTLEVIDDSTYTAILEGFLGWFLLSIFSVSLISQILQN